MTYMATSDVRYANCLACHQPRALPGSFGCGPSFVRSPRVRWAVSAPGALGDVSPAAAARIVIDRHRPGTFFTVAVTCAPISTQRTGRRSPACKAFALAPPLHLHAWARPYELYLTGVCDIYAICFRAGGLRTKQASRSQPLLLY